jgi:heme/copper-type cytochrome/quinol oxidase subunit 3
VEASASAPLASHIEPEPPGWQPRAIWASVRLFCGSITFFFVSFLFAYFYLRSLDIAHGWRPGKVDPSLGLGTAVMVVFVLSAVTFWVAARRRTLTVPAGATAVLLALLAIALQCVEYTTLGFGPASGAYASVFVGWTAFYALFALGGVYWLETQTASVWRAARYEIDRARREGVPADEEALIQAGLDACAFYWAYFVGIGVVAYVVLYVI